MARAEGFAQDLLPLMDELGDCCSALESIVDDSVWPLPKFGELLFTR
jgi:glutamine synthetase